MLKEDLWRKLDDNVKSENISSFRSFKKKLNKTADDDIVPPSQSKVEEYVAQEITYGGEVAEKIYYDTNDNDYNDIDTGTGPVGDDGTATADSMVEPPEAVPEEIDELADNGETVAETAPIIENYPKDNTEGVLPQDTTGVTVEKNADMTQDTVKNNDSEIVEDGDSVQDDSGSYDNIPAPVNELVTVEEIIANTNMVSIPQILENPYLLFFDASQNGNYQICDANGSPKLTISDGNIIGPSYLVIGHINTDERTKTTTVTDMNNNPLYSVDSHGQMFSGDCYIGRINLINDFANIRDFHEQIIAIQDKTAGIWQTPEGNILGQVKPM